MFFNREQTCFDFWNEQNAFYKYLKKNHMWTYINITNTIRLYYASIRQLYNIIVVCFKVVKEILLILPQLIIWACVPFSCNSNTILHVFHTFFICFSHCLWNSLTSFCFTIRNVESPSGRLFKDKSDNKMFSQFLTEHCKARSSIILMWSSMVFHEMYDIISLELALYS